MKLLHLASFRGNIGDNISHGGLRWLLDCVAPGAVVEPLEIRRYYQNYRGSDRGRFDRSFIDLINRHDGAVFGGGGFLEYHFPHSQTGTTFDMDPELLRLVCVPVVMSSLGCIVKQRIPEGNANKFTEFLDAIMENPLIHLAVRNDGSREHLFELDRHYGNEIPEILDNGFFYPIKGPSQQGVFGKSYAAINVPRDQLLMARGGSEGTPEAVFYEQMARSLVYLVEQWGLDLVFVPHIAADLEAISRLLSCLPATLVRNRVSVASCRQGELAAWEQALIYRDARIAVVGRLHANVCALVGDTPSLGLSVLDRVRYMYESIGFGDQVVSPQGDFSEMLNKRIDGLLCGSGDPAFLARKPEFKRLRQLSLEFYRGALA